MGKRDFFRCSPQRQGGLLVQLLAPHQELYAVLHVGNDPDLEDMRNASDEVVARQTVIHHVVLLKVTQQGGPKKGNVPLLSKGKAFQDRGGVTEGVKKVIFRNVELPGRLQENLPRDTLEAEPARDLFSDVLRAAV
jgi:hypothetical protein